MTIKAVVFDAYGTLFDVYSIQVLAEELYPSHGADIAVKWRDKQIEYTRLITQSDPAQRIWQSILPSILGADTPVIGVHPRQTETKS